MKCRHCGLKMEAEFVDIGIGEQQVSDWQCQNISCPEHLEWLERDAIENKNYQVNEK